MHPSWLGVSVGWWWVLGTCHPHSPKRANLLANPVGLTFLKNRSARDGGGRHQGNPIPTRRSERAFRLVRLA